MNKIVSGYRVIRGTLRDHTSLSDHFMRVAAEDEAYRWNFAYQTDEYRVIVIYEDGSRGVLK